MNANDYPGVVAYMVDASRQLPGEYCHNLGNHDGHEAKIVTFVICAVRLPVHGGL